MGSLRSMRRIARRGANLRMEILEDRVVPDGTPGAFYDPNSDTPAPVPPPDAIPIEWLGQTRLASPGHWIVQVDNLTGTPAEQISAFQPVVDSLNLGLTIDTHLGLDGMFRLAGPAGLTVQVLSDSLEQIEGFLHVEPDLVEAAGQVIPNDADFNRLWGMHNTGNNPFVPPGIVDIDVDAPEAWDLTGPSRGTTQIVIAIDDTGVDYTHPDLYLNIWVNQTEIPAAVRPTSRRYRRRRLDHLLGPQRPREHRRASRRQQRQRPHRRRRHPPTHGARGVDGWPRRQRARHRERLRRRLHRLGLLQQRKQPER